MAIRYKLLKDHGKYVYAYRINLRCPECHRLGTLDTLGDIQDIAVFPVAIGNQSLLLGHRRCPNPACQLLIQVRYIYESEGGVNLLESYPAERLDFDADSIPEPIVNALEEAITCHAQGCYFAAAIMVRKTVEELCHLQGTKGKTLQERIRDLKTKVLIPPDMLEGIDNLRLLGNDAAHIELKNFDGIGPEEVEVGILLSKELLKIVYQSSMLSDRLKALKK
jgi:hypothetical protein